MIEERIIAHDALWVVCVIYSRHLDSASAVEAPAEKNIIVVRVQALLGCRQFVQPLLWPGRTTSCHIIKKGIRK